MPATNEPVLQSPRVMVMVPAPMAVPVGTARLAVDWACASFCTSMAMPVGAVPAAATIVRKPPAGSDVAKGQVLIEERTYDQGDALKFEIEAFLRAVREGEGEGQRLRLHLGDGRAARGSR